MRPIAGSLLTLLLVLLGLPVESEGRRYGSANRTTRSSRSVRSARSSDQRLDAADILHHLDEASPLTAPQGALIETSVVVTADPTLASGRAHRLALVFATAASHRDSSWTPVVATLGHASALDPRILPTRGRAPPAA